MLGLHVIQAPSGKWVYVGSVPVDIYFVPEATQEQIAAGQHCGERFGPPKMRFDTKAEAIQYAANHGYTVNP